MRVSVCSQLGRCWDDRLRTQPLEAVANQKDRPSNIMPDSLLRPVLVTCHHRPGLGLQGPPKPCPKSNASAPAIGGRSPKAGRSLVVNGGQ